MATVSKRSGVWIKLIVPMRKANKMSECKCKTALRCVSRCVSNCIYIKHQKRMEVPSKTEKHLCVICQIYVQRNGESLGE